MTLFEYLNPPFRLNYTTLLHFLVTKLKFVRKFKDEFKNIIIDTIKQWKKICHQHLLSPPLQHLKFKKRLKILDVYMNLCLYVVFKIY